MKFDYDSYRRVLCFTAIFMLVCGILLLIGCIIGIFMFKKYLVSEGKIKGIIKVVGIVLALCISVFFITYSFSHLCYGINLINEKPNDALIVVGKIEEIKELRNPLPHDYIYISNYIPDDYSIEERYAHLITISDKQYYIMIKGDLQVGDYVEIKYLPKSTIILEINRIDPLNG